MLTDHAAYLHFAPSLVAMHNLLQEGIPYAQTVPARNFMYYEELIYAVRANKPAGLEACRVCYVGFALARLHRPRHTRSLKSMIDCVICDCSCGKQVILLMRPRPRAGKQTLRLPNFESLGIFRSGGYIRVVCQGKSSDLIAMTSREVQHGAYFHGKPCNSLRDQTAWAELLVSDLKVLIRLGFDSIMKTLGDSEWIPSNPFNRTADAHNITDWIG